MRPPPPHLRQLGRREKPADSAPQRSKGAGRGCRAHSDPINEALTACLGQATDAPRAMGTGKRFRQRRAG